MSKLKSALFAGAATALVTPFRNGAIDFDSFGRMIDRQISAGIDGLVVCGTTGESATLSREERLSLIRFAVERASHRVPIIAGTGSNDTARMVFLSKEAEIAGADGLLLVTPYYNKGNHTGICQSYFTVAEAVKCPILLYNVPSRTGVNLTLAEYRELAQHERIIGVKEASGNLSAVADLAAELGDSFDIYSGNDDQIVPILSLGGKGVISVASNLIPAEVHRLCAACLAGDFTAGRRIQLRYLPLVRELFSEVNPVPVKAACGMLGICSEETRLPLGKMDPKKRELLRKALEKANLLPPHPGN